MIFTTVFQIEMGKDQTNETNEMWRAIKHEARLRRRVKAKGASEKLSENGIKFEQDENDTIRVRILNGQALFYPRTAYYSGTGIGSGRGLNNFIKAVKRRL